MSVTAFFNAAIDLVQHAQVDFMLAGSFASSHWGDSRSTRDLDLVVVITPENVAELDRTVDRGRWYFDVESLNQAVTHQSMCNLIDKESGWKLDLIVRKDRSFSVEEFRRRVRATVLGRMVWVASAEDVVLSKLEWARESSSDRQVGDAAGILRIQSMAIDQMYLDEWAYVLDVVALLERARNLAAGD